MIVAACTMLTVSGSGDSVVIIQPAPGFWMIFARFGFMERPDVPKLLAGLEDDAHPFGLAHATYFAGLEKIVGRADGQGLPRIVQVLFGYLVRNSARATDAMHIPPAQLLELGRQVAV